MDPNELVSSAGFPVCTCQCTCEQQPTPQQIPQRRPPAVAELTKNGPFAGLDPFDALVAEMRDFVHELTKLDANCSSRKQQTKQRSRSAERKSGEGDRPPMPHQLQPPPQPQPQPPPPTPATSQEIPVVVKDTRLRLAPSANAIGGQAMAIKQQQQQRVAAGGASQALLHHPPAAQHQQHPQSHHPMLTRAATAPPPLPPRGFPGVGDVIGGFGGVVSGGGGGGGRVRAADASNGGKASNGAGRHPGGGASQPPVSSRQLCSHCGLELGSGAAMAIESLHLYYHVKCFRCCVCDTPLGNGSQGADVRVRRDKLHCPSCFSSDEVPR